MVLGFDEEEKTLDNAINFNADNIFEYLSYIINHRNGNWFGSKSDEIIKEILSLLETIPEAESKSFDIENMITQALTETSQYAYAAGFKEACRLEKTLKSF